MKQTKKTSLIVAFLALGFILCLPVAFAKAAEAEDNVNQENANRNRENVNERQGNVNEDQEDVNEDQDDINDNQDNANKDQEKDKQFNGEKHRSAVATFVQSLLDVANREKGGIGEQVKTIANAQNETINQAAEAIDKIKNRSKIKTFFFGTDYKNIGMLRSGITTTKNQINQLDRLLEKATSTDTKVTVQTQIQTLTQEQQKIEDFIKTNESRFNLLGWLVRLFNR